VRVFDFMSNILNVKITVKRNTNLMYNFLIYFVNLYIFRVYLGPSSGGTTVTFEIGTA